MRLRTTLAAALVATVLSAGTAVAGTVAPAASAATTEAAAVVVAPDGGGVVRSGKGLGVSVTVTNTGSARLSAGRLTFSLDAAPVASASALVSALTAAPPEVLQGQLATAKAAVPAIDVGGSETVRATISKDDLSNLLTPANGARLLYAQYLSRSTQVVSVIKESSVVKIASGSDASVDLGAVIPILAPQGSTGVVDIASQQTLTAPDGAWSRALRAAQRDPQAAIALDPEVIASIRIAGDAAPPEVQGFLTELSGLPNEFLRLPYGDTDVTLVRAAGARSSLDPDSFAGVTLAAADAGGPTPAPTATAGSTTADATDLTDWNWSDRAFAWPVPRTSSNADIARFARDGDQVLLSSDDVQDSAVRRTSGALARVEGAQVVVSDSSVSSLLVAASAEGPSGDAALATLVGVLATAAVTGESSAVVATVGRTSDTSRLAPVLDLLGRQPWIRSSAISDLGDASAATTLQLRTGTVAAARVSTARSLLSGEHQVQELGAAAVSGADTVTAPSRLALLALLSAAWRGNDDVWEDAATGAEAGFRAVLGMVSLAQGADSNAIGTDGTLKVTVKNTLAVPVAVTVRASASNNRLQFPVPSARVIVPAGGQNVAKLNYRSISNGSTDVSLTLSTKNGTVLARGQREFTVAAGFDTIVAIVLLVALALLLGLGVYRNITRRRQRVAAA